MMYRRLISCFNWRASSSLFYLSGICFMFSCTPGIEHPKPEIKDLTGEMTFFWDVSGSRPFEEIQLEFFKGNFYSLDNLEKYNNPAVLWGVHEITLDSLTHLNEGWGFCLVTSPDKFRHSYNGIEIFYEDDEGRITRKVSGTLTHTNKKEKGWEFSRNCIHLNNFNVSPEGKLRLYIKLFSAQSYREKIYGYETTQIEEYNRWISLVASQPFTTYFQNQLLRDFSIFSTILSNSVHPNR